MLHDHGISISYDRVLMISAQLGEAVMKSVSAGWRCVPPTPHFYGNLFTTSALDNIDHNPTSTTASSSFSKL